MSPPPRQPKGSPALTAAPKTLKRLREKHSGVIEASDFKDDGQHAVLVDTGFLRPVTKGRYICGSPSARGKSYEGKWRSAPASKPPTHDSCCARCGARLAGSRRQRVGLAGAFESTTRRNRAWSPSRKLLVS